MANLIPPASVYDEFGRFDLLPYVTRGDNYTVTGGANEIANLGQLQNGGIATQLSDGQPHAFTAAAAGDIRIANPELADLDVTATLEAVADPPTPPAQVDPQALVTASRCFHCLSPATQEEIQTLIIATAAGLSTDPNELIALSRCMSCLSYQTLLEIKAFLLASHGGLSTDPNVRAQESRCYSCIPQGYLSTVQTYLLAQDTASPSTDTQTLASLVSCWSCVPHPTLLEIQVYLLARMYNESTDPNVLANLARCFSCLPFPVLQYTLTQVLDELENDGGISGCTDDPPQLIPVLVGTYDMTGDLTDVQITLPKVCCDPDHVALYEADAADGTGAVAYLNVAVGNSHAGESNLVINVPIVIPFTKDYLVAKQVCGDATESAFSNGIAVVDAGMVAADNWADRVEANGGARPSNASINAAATFYNSLSTAGILSKMKAVNFFAPDSIIAAITPFIKGPGLDPWGNSGALPFVLTDLTINGLRGDAVNGIGNQFLNTGVNPFTAFSNDTDFGMSIYSTFNANSTVSGTFGAADSTFGQVAAIKLSQAGDTYYDSWTPLSANGRIIENAQNTYVGFHSFSRLTASNFRAFKANSGDPFHQISVVNSTGGSRPNGNIYCHALNVIGFGAQYDASRISFAAIHFGLDATETEDLFDAVQALRTAFGGGFI